MSAVASCVSVNFGWTIEEDPGLLTALCFYPVIQFLFQELRTAPELLVSVPGYVGKWKRHWFVLNDAVLYYFITPQHQDEAPRCIIPLEGINISPIGATDLSIGLRVRGYLGCFTARSFPCIGVRAGQALSLPFVAGAFFDAISHPRGVTTPDPTATLASYRNIRTSTPTSCSIAVTLIKPFLA